MPNYIVEVNADGTQIWKNDKGDLHREDGPAVIWKDGTQKWYIHNKLHREDGPSIIYPNGQQHWHINGKLHREDGPATIYPNGTQYWHINGDLHREDGPAVIWKDGTQFWYINGKQLTEKQFNDRKQSMDGKEITIDGITYILKKK